MGMHPTHEHGISLGWGPDFDRDDEADIRAEAEVLADYPELGSTFDGVKKHYGPGPHPKTGSPQLVHGVKGRLGELTTDFFNNKITLAEYVGKAGPDNWPTIAKLIGMPQHAWPGHYSKTWRGVDDHIRSRYRPYDDEDLFDWITQSRWTKMRVRYRTAADIYATRNRDPELRAWMDKKVKEWEEAYPDPPLRHHAMQKAWDSSTRNYYETDPDLGMPEDLPEFVVALQVHEVDNAWVQSAFDNMPESIALQHAIADLFNTDRSRFSQFSGDLTTNVALVQGRERYEEDKPFYQAWAKAVYARTQKELTDAGFENVEVYRGMDWPEHKVDPRPEWMIDVEMAGPNGRLVEFPSNPGSSWSASGATARAFSSPHTGAVLATRVRRENIFATSITGLGAFNEEEVIAVFPERARARAFAHNFFADMVRDWRKPGGAHGVFETGDDGLHPPGWVNWTDEDKAKWQHWQDRGVEWWPGKDQDEAYQTGWRKWYEDLPATEQRELRARFQAEYISGDSWQSFLYSEFRQSGGKAAEKPEERSEEEEKAVAVAWFAQLPFAERVAAHESFVYYAEDMTWEQYVHDLWVKKVKKGGQKK